MDIFTLKWNHASKTLNPMKNLLFFLMLFVAAGSVMAQKGTLTGVIVDENSGEELIGVNVFIPDIQRGGVTDLSGRYNIPLDSGIYTLEVSYITHHKKVIEDVEIEPGRTTTLNIGLLEASREMDEVIISARRMDNNEISLLRLQKKSLPVQDGISSQEIQRIGFTNSAESMRLVTGATVENGSYIVMRGLGDRYSISSMDGIVLPTTDPYRNSASLDLIPSSMVENIVVKKTFSPELPGNFSGGAVDISTKSLPDRYYLKVSSSFGYNDQTTLNQNFKREPINNRLRRLGFDDGSRQINDKWRDNEYIAGLNRYLIKIQNNQLSEDEIAEFNALMRTFSDRKFTVIQDVPEPDHSFNLAFGNRHFIGDKQIGFNFGLNYSKSYVHYDERQINNFTARIPDGNTSRMRAFQLNRGTESISKVNNGYIGSVAFQLNPYNEFTLTSIYNNNAAESILDMVDGAYPGALSSGTYNNRVLSFKQRQLFNNQLKGRHLFDGFEIRWSGNYITSRQYEPDTRFIGSPVDTEGQYFFVREVQLPFHFFRDLFDTSYNLKLDTEYKLNNRISFKTGGLYNRKDRSFEEFRFQLENNGTNPSMDEFLSFREASGDFERFFAPGNTGILGRDEHGNLITGLTYRNQTRPENSYTGSEKVGAAYVVGVFELTNALKVFGGVRVEKTDFMVESGSRSANAIPGVIDVLDLLPSANIIYALNSKSNLRLSGSQTLARPNMRELAPFASFDLLGGFPIVGNPEINRTNIQNADFRYEIFPDAGELFALSVFLKNFKNPIVLELDVATDQPQYQYVNTNSGRLYGFEVEFRKKLDFIASSFRNLKFSTNFTYINSRVDLSRLEFETRQLLDSSIKSYRPFPNQSSYIANVMLIYENAKTGWDGAIYANITGPRLTANGAGAAPDIFEMFGKLNSDNDLVSTRPTPDLSLRIQKKFWDHLNASLSVNNLLDYSIIQYQEDAGQYLINGAYNPGRTFKIGLTYSIN